MAKLFMILCGLVIGQDCFQQNPLPPVGQWREHLPYNSAIDLAAGGGFVYCATPFSLFRLNTGENSIDRMSRITGLSETGISAIHFDDATGKLFIAYSNSNIDIIYRNDIINIPDLERDNISGDKSIYNIYARAGDYYLSTGLGVIVVDGDRYEIRDSWFIGSAGNTVRVNGVSADAGFFYAATDEGLKRVANAGVDPADFTNWQLLSGSNGLPSGIAKNVLSLASGIIAQVNDSIFVLSNNNWSLLYGDEWPIVSVNISGNKIFLCQRKPGGDSRVLILHSDGTVLNVLHQPAVISFPRKALEYESFVWIADQFGGLSKFDQALREVYKPASPEGTATGEILVSRGAFIAAAGDVNDSWNYQYNGNGIYRFADGGWTNYNRFRIPELDSLLDFVTVTADDRNGSIWAGSYGGGLLWIKPGGEFEIFKQDSPIGPTVGDPGSYRVSGLVLDDNYHLWVANFGSALPLHVRMQNGSWKSFTIPFGLFGNAVSQVLVDALDQKWIVSPLGNGLIVFNHGNSIEDLSDDRWKMYKAGLANGNLPSNDVFCVAQDKDGFIWIGTGDGIAVVQCPQEIFSVQGCAAIRPVVQENGFPAYLFAGEEVKSIAVDGANRKWIATRNGAWLVSSEGDKVIYRFTEENSPLLSNDVKRIAVDGKTGEVYFATAKGICSFRSTATTGEPSNDQILVFPNPVPPGYGGIIAIRGLVNNAIVKITELNGRLVFQTRALGGQAVWDGKDYKGRKISSGIYLVLISDDGRTENQAAKIFFISQ